MSTNSLPPTVVNIDDLRKMAKRRLPRVVFDYLDGGADSEITLRENCRIFDDVIFRPRWAVAVPETDIRARVLSFDLSFPAILAPVGYSRMMYPGAGGGECAAAAAAGRARTLYPLSPLPRPPLANIAIPGKGPMPLIDVGAALASAVVPWEVFRWLRELWPGPIIAKGVLSADDARRAVDHGAAAIVVSNHGGRQLDTVSPTLRVLPEVIAAANGQAEVLLDGGIRRGSDVVKALCVGARAVLIGRAYAYGLGAA